MNLADDAQVAAPADAHILTVAAKAGRHVRIDGPRGAIHVWIPPGYRPETGATILYIHGYYDNADTSFVGHRLPEQFAMSSLNAMFIVPSVTMNEGRRMRVTSSPFTRPNAMQTSSPQAMAR